MEKNQYKQFYHNVKQILSQNDITALYVIIREMQQFLHKTNNEIENLQFEKDMKYFYTLMPTLNFLQLSDVDQINYIRLLIIFENYTQLKKEHDEQLNIHNIIQKFSIIKNSIQTHEKLDVAKAMIAFLTKGNIKLPEEFCEQFKSYMVMEKIAG